MERSDVSRLVNRAMRDGSVSPTSERRPSPHRLKSTKGRKKARKQ